MRKAVIATPVGTPMLRYNCRNGGKESDLAVGAKRTTGREDEILAEGIRRRDPSAMEALYDRHSRQAFGLAYRILGDGSSAEDVVQEAFLTVWRQAERIDSARGRLSSYLMTVVHHKAVDLMRSRRGQAVRHLPLDPNVVGQEEADMVEGLANSSRREAIQGALSSLPPEQLEPIRLAYFEGLTHVEIADKLAVPLGTVKSRLRLGLEKMRSALEGRVNK
jgi:RNA polymerase sigma-70 factor (ECF subfamily)